MNESENRVMRFIKCREGICYYDISNPRTHDLTLYAFVKGTCLIHTARGNEALMSQKEIMLARRARDLQNALEWSSIRSLQS